MNNYEKYEIIRNKKGYKDSDVCKMANIASATMSDWKSGKSSPKIEKLAKIADILECDIYELLEIESRPNKTIRIKSEQVSELKSRFSNLVQKLEVNNISLMKEIVTISDLIEDMENQIKN